MGSNTDITTRPRNRRRTVTAFTIATALALSACGGDDDADSSDTAASAEATADVAFDQAGAEMSADDGDPGFVATGDTVAPEAGEAPAEGGFDIGVVGRDVVIEMRVVVSSDDIQRTVASVTAAASTLGGGIASSDVNYGSGDEDEGFAVIVVKVPPAEVDRMLAGLDDTGTVQSIDQNARDVTDQLVDLDVRIANARTSVDNVRGFMEQTENLNELVSLEAELTRRQTDLEQLEAQQRNLADRVALSTITVEIVPTAAVPEPAPEPEDDSLGGALESGWEAFTALLFGVAFVIAATLPFLVVGLVGALVLWLLVRRRDRRAAAAHRPTMPAPSAAARSATEATVDADHTDDDREPEPVG